MNIDNMFQFVFFGIFALIVGSFIIKIFKNGGFKAAMFGAPIQSTAGEVSGSGSKLMSVVVKVHTLGGGSSEKAIGIELVTKSFASYHMMPVTLSALEASKLASLLQSAVKSHHVT